MRCKSKRDIQPTVAEDSFLGPKDRIGEDWMEGIEALEIGLAWLNKLHRYHFVRIRRPSKRFFSFRTIASWIR